MSDLATVGAVFFFGMAVDILWIKTTQEVTRDKKRPVRAGLYSVALAAPSLFGFVEVSKDIFLAAPYLLGLFVGTVLSMTVLSDGGSDEQNRD